MLIGVLLLVRQYLANVVWSRQESGDMQAFVAHRDRLFRMVYLPTQQVLGIAPCDAQGNDVRICAYGNDDGLFILRRLVLTQHHAGVLLPAAIQAFLEWAFNTFEQLGELAREAA